MVYLGVQGLLRIWFPLKVYATLDPLAGVGKRTLTSPVKASKVDGYTDEPLLTTIGPTHDGVLKIKTAVPKCTMDLSTRVTVAVNVTAVPFDAFYPSR